MSALNLSQPCASGKSSYLANAVQNIRLGNCLSSGTVVQDVSAIVNAHPTAKALGSPTNARHKTRQTLSQYFFSLASEKALKAAMLDATGFSSQATMLKSTGDSNTDEGGFDELAEMEEDNGGSY